MKKIKITKEQFETLKKSGFVSEETIKGGIDRVQKSFNKEFTGKDIKNVDEEENFNIKKPNTDLPVNTQKPLGRKHNISEMEENKTKSNKKSGNDKVTKEIKDLLKHLYGYTPEFNSDYWVGEKEKSIDEIIEHLMSKGLLVKKGRNYIVPKSIGSNEEAKAGIEECMRTFVGEPMEELDETMDGGYPAGAENDPNAPWNREDPEPIYNHTDFKLFVYNDDLALLKDKYTKEFFMLDFNDNHVNYEGMEMTEDDINDFLNNNETNLSKILIPLDENLLNELGEMYGLNSFFLKQIEKIRAEMSGDFNDLNQAGLKEGVDWSKAYPREKGKPKMNDVTPKKRTGPENKAILDKVRALRKKELDSRESISSKHPTDQDEIDETSCAGGSSGAFTAPMGTEPIKRQIPTVTETLTVAGAGKFQYDAPGLANVGRDGEFKKGGKKPKAFKTPQWAGGSMVEQPECSKLNNNKEAQNGGCNSGASSLKMKKSSGSVNAPSLAENQIFEEIAKQTGKSIEEIKQIISNKK